MDLLGVCLSYFDNVINFVVVNTRAANKDVNIGTR